LVVRNIQALPGARRQRRLTGPRIAVGALLLVLAVLVGLTVHDIFFAASGGRTPGRLVPVSLTTVTSTVTGTGSLEPVNQANVNFKVGGTVSEIDVSVGQQVQAGQVLAKLDPTALQDALQEAQANLQSAEANLQNAQDPVSAAQLAQLEQQISDAEQAYNDTVAQVNVTAQQDQQAVAQAQQSYNACVSQNGSNAGTACASQLSALQKAQEQQQLDGVSDPQKLDQASQAVTNAKDTLAVDEQPKPGAVQSAQASVISAQAAVQTAQQNLADATLTAPISGEVVEINGAVGDVVSAGSGVASSIGAAGASPSSGSGAAASGAASSGASSGTGSGSSSSPFILIEDLSSWEAVVPFAEADAAKLQPGQQASITFAAIPNLTITGTLLSVSPVAQVVSSVVNYDATFKLLQTDPRLRAGMTANAAVTVAQANDVLAVPNLAVRTVGGTTVVDVYSRGRMVAVPVTTGLIGDTMTQVSGDLRAGEEVVEPIATLSTGSGLGGGGGRFGGGGVGILGGLGRG
jgi:HlyD family secretion protein